MVDRLFEIYDPHAFVSSFSLNWFPAFLILFVGITEF